MQKKAFDPSPKESSARSSVSMWELLLEVEYEDYELDASRRIVVEQLVTDLHKNLLSNAAGPTEVTEGSQSSSEKWKELRKLLITASRLKTFTLPKMKQQLFNLIQHHLWSKSEVIRIPALEYGKENEAVAKEQYEAYTSCLCFEVQETGLWINPKYPGIGASPDALVFDPIDNSSGLLEIKCPKILQKLKPIEVYQLSKQQLSYFCCTLEGDTLQLKRNHEYYVQIQTQMAITERSWCDFIVWTSLDFNIERIFYEPNFIRPLLQKAVHFHRNILAPEYFEMRAPRRLIPFDFSFHDLV